MVRAAAAVGVISPGNTVADDDHHRPEPVRGGGVSPTGAPLNAGESDIADGGQGGTVSVIDPARPPS